ncbi:MAG: ferredoxin-type protein NapG [Verrucomicrobiales bacterium]|jgi:ferredoxin-type protein NapG
MADFSRRQLFRLRLGGLGSEIGKAVASKRPDGEVEEQPFLRPPGALEDEDDFLSSCERCHACADACPHDVIRQFGPAFGKMEGTPFIDPASQPCRWCEDMPCVNACPSGALSLNENGATAPVAKVKLNLDRCLNTEGILCDTCAWRCPDHLKAIRIVDRKPIVDTSSCSGCGMCLFYCDAEPTAFEFIYDEEDVVSDGSSGAPASDRRNDSRSDFSNSESSNGSSVSSRCPTGGSPGNSE